MYCYFLGICMAIRLHQYLMAPLIFLQTYCICEFGNHLIRIMIHSGEDQHLHIDRILYLHITLTGIILMYYVCGFSYLYMSYMHMHLCSYVLLLFRYLYNNQITSIPDGAFALLTELEYL